MRLKKFSSPTLCGLYLMAASPLIFASAFDTDTFLRSVDLPKLIALDYALNLEAQLKDPSASTNNVNDMDDFIALAVNEKSHTVITQFDNKQNIIKHQTFNKPWIGVKKFTQNEIPTVTLQEGFSLVQTCMAAKNHPLSGQIARITLYKTIQTDLVIYDYIFTDPNFAPYCQEVLYAPTTQECTLGMVVQCHHHLD